MARICSVCGYETDEEDEYCQECGAVIEEGDYNSY